jgi:phytoene synthase
MKHMRVVLKPLADLTCLQEGMIADLVGSSNYHAISDDALKDQDNAGWVMGLARPIRTQWIERIRWIRLIDRFAEHELLCEGHPALQIFLTGWQHLALTGEVEPNSAYHELLTAMQLCWFAPSQRPSMQLTLKAWKRYLHAIATYHQNDLVINTMAEYEQMLADLAGSFFQVLPFLAENHHQAVSYFGMLDQFYNHLRDLHEDANQGICNLPSDLLDRFGVSRDEILQQQAMKNPGYHKMMQFWLEDYLPTLHRNASQLLAAEDLHPSWQILSAWSIGRYQRIERIFRECEFDYIRFSQVYWQQIRADLPMMLNHARRCSAATSPRLLLKFFPPTLSARSFAYGHLGHWKRLVSMQPKFNRSPLMSAL